jgi:GR25 family glycosyltransferase involved in LPS biosynthesis
MSENIEKIIFINLEKRKDRLAEITNELTNYELPFERFDGINHKIGLSGCGYSHLNVLKLAKERGYKNVLILEDDFMFLVSKEEFEHNLQLFFNSKIDYDVCMISYNVLQQEEVPNYPFINKIIEAQTASGYIVNSHYYDKLIDLYEEAIPLIEQTGQHWIYANDQIWKKFQPLDNWYFFNTRLGKQRDGYSDTNYNFLAYNC